MASERKAKPSRDDDQDDVVQRLAVIEVPPGMARDGAEAVLRAVAACIGDLDLSEILAVMQRVLDAKREAARTGSATLELVWRGSAPQPTKNLLHAGREPSRDLPAGGRPVQEEW